MQQRNSNPHNLLLEKQKMPQKLWVQLKEPGRILGPNRVSTDGCSDVDDFLEEIKKQFALTVPAPSLKLFNPDETELKSTDTLASLGSAGIDGQAPLIVETTAVAVLPAQVEPILSLLPCRNPFYKNICNATEQDAWLSFDESLPSTALTRLLVRDSFKSIASSIESGISNKIINKAIRIKAVVTGSQGIGKSLFLIYLLWRLVKEGKRVLFIYQPFMIYYDGQGGVFQFNSLPSSLHLEFWTADLWCLFDAKGKKEEHLGEIPFEWCRLVLSTSPNRALVNDFKKSPPPRVFYMPPWTEAELETIAPYFETGKGWRGRFKIIGGIPRHILEYMVDEPAAFLRDACARCDLDDCIGVLHLSSTVDDNAHSLIHMTSVHPFTESSVAFASPTALSIIVETKGVEAKRKMPLFGLCADNPLTTALCEMLEKGGESKGRKLVHANKRAKLQHG